MRKCEAYREVPYIFQDPETKATFNLVLNCWVNRAGEVEDDGLFILNVVRVEVSHAYATDPPDIASGLELSLAARHAINLLLGLRLKTNVGLRAQFADACRAYLAALPD